MLCKLLRLLTPIVLLLSLSACVAYPAAYSDGGYYAAPTVIVPVYPHYGYRDYGYHGGGHHYRY